ncbi:hypothetical protein [Massilia sp. HP4]|uniref:hypothetical protein n=1 Tax=Massilia sp. HP4 TaxID=2562316 RepID=UPI0010C136CB|nr:hypothetical protein [Massilia sp. HP4]
MDLQLPKDIYISVLSELDTVLQSLKDLPSDKDTSQAKDKAVQIFSELSKDLRGNIESLSKNAEWDTFTIAFYGETNAGKSTIIETMRMLLNESGKLAQQQEFRDLQQKYGISGEHLAQMRNAVEEAAQACSTCQASLDALDDHFSRQTHIQRERVDELRQQIARHKETASVWRKLLDLFIKLPQQKETAHLEKELQAAEAAKRQEAAALEQQQRAARQEHEGREQSLKQAEASLALLESRADGAIIGNGTSDFTLDTTPYHFSNGEQRFALLDVPGIEGKETRVMDAILAGVQKAHAVFYVTNKAAAPQKGDDRQPGTLEKIRQHLGAQTEVWTVYNKRVTNPIQLKADRLVSDDEQASLQDLDRRMHEVLGEQYRGTVALSAYPAFLAAASCLVPDSQNAANKAKFMAKRSGQELLERSGVAAFRELLLTDLVRDFKRKITRSNYNKANQVVRGTIDEVSKTLRESFTPLGKELKKDAEQAQMQLETALDALKSRLESQGESAISRFNNNVRKKIYDEIEGDISNDDFKDALERFIAREQATLVAELPGIMQKEVEKFQVQIDDIVKRFQTFAAELMDAYGNIRVTGLGGKLDLKIDIDNGINIPGLLGALVGGALMIWNPAGWVVLAIGAITVLAGAVKAVIGFFSSDYKKSQQRKSANSNLDNIADKMRESLNDSLAAALPQLEPKVEALKAVLDKPAAQIASVVTMLGKSERQLKNLSKKIETAGTL